MAQPFESTFIVFVDMLGFANLVERNAEDVDDLSPIFTSIELYSPTQEESLLGYRFVNFHRCLNEARAQLQLLGNGTAIIFSDSAFFRIDTLEGAINFSRELMFNFVTSQIPVRMGIASGTYRMLRFMTDSSAHVSFHMSQFLGSGIVRAYNAERCGISGLRILLHPNLEPLINSEIFRIVPVTSTQATRLNVQFEVNYLDSNPSNLGGHYDDCIQFDSLRQMAREAEEEFQYHYEETFNAWNRMRIQLGRKAYPKEKYLDRDRYEESLGMTPPKNENGH